MVNRGTYIFCFLVVEVTSVLCGDRFHEYSNVTDLSTCQIYEFKKTHPDPIGILTTSAGKLVEIRETVTFNSDSFSNPLHIDTVTHLNNERIPERVVHAKGGGAFGYFEVTNDVSKYTIADVLNGIGKKTGVFVRFSTVIQNMGGNDASRDVKGFSIKFYTIDGNWDLLCLSTPVFLHRDPLDFQNVIHALKRNPKTNLFDTTTRWDIITKKPEALAAFLFVLSDYGIPNGYRKMDAFAIHTFEINNKYGERYFVKFNLRTQQGVEILPSDVAQNVSGQDLDYFNRDLYNAIENKTYPVWDLEMDVMTIDDIKKVGYNPFEITRLWKIGTYQTVPIGRLVLNKNPDNFFKTVELSAFNPGNLVPGIPGPMDNLFRTRRSSYRDTQVYRLGVNHNRIQVNKPLYSNVYNRDGKPPVKDNMRDAPNYYPNSFNGPVPYVDPSRPKERFIIFDANSVDLESASNFYNYYLRDDAQKQRLIDNIVPSLVTVAPYMQRRVIRLLTLTDLDLGRRVAAGLAVALEAPPTPPPRAIKVPRIL